MSTSSPTSTQPGWYDDPQAPGMLRWFDGEAWSPFTKERSADVAPTVPQPRPAPSADPPAHAPGQGAGPPGGAASSTRAPTPPPVPLAPMAVEPAPLAKAAVAVTRPSAPRAAAAVPASTPDPLGAHGTIAAFTVTPPVAGGAARTPTAARRLVGRVAENLPGWLPTPVAGPLRTRLTALASRDDRLSGTLTAEHLKDLVLPGGSAWQGSVAGCLGVVTILLSVWPVAGLAAWALTCGFAGWALLRIRRDVLLGGKVHAWFGVACGIGPLWTGLLMVAYR